MLELYVQKFPSTHAGALPLYEETAVRGERELEAPDADAEAEEAPPLEAPLEQALELLVVLADSRRFRPLLAPGLPQLLHLTIGAGSA